MNDLEVKRFQISRTGVHTDSNGNEHTFSDTLFNKLVARFNQLANRDNQKHPYILNTPKAKLTMTQHAIKAMAMCLALNWIMGDCMR